MQGFDPEEVESLRKKLEDRLKALHDLQHPWGLPALPATSPSLQPAREAVATAYGHMLHALGSAESAATIQQEAQVLMDDLDTPIQPKVLCLVEKAENVQLQHQRLADHWPAAPLPQTWPCFLLYVLWCVVRSVAATCLADVSAVLGLPLYQGWLRWTLAACHFILLATTVLLIRKVIPVEGWAAISLLWAAAPLIPVIPALHSDVPARAAAVRVLRGVSATAATTAENLPTCLPQNVELPSLRAALRALAVACDDTLRRDQGRLTAVERNADRWEQPLRTLWRLAQVLFARPVRRSSKLPPIS